MARSGAPSIPPRTSRHSVRHLADRVLAQLAEPIRRLPDAAHPRHHSAEQVLRALLLQALTSTPNERLLRARLEVDAASRRFVGLQRGSPLWSLAEFSLSRARLFEAGIAPLFFQQLLAVPNIVGLLHGERWTVDDLLLEAWTSQGGEAASRHGSRLGSLLVLPSVLDSARYVPYLEAHAGQVPLEAVLVRLRMAIPGPLALACESAAIAERLAPVAEANDVRLLRLDPGSLTTQLVSASAQLHVGHLAVFNAAAALLPGRIIREICRHHLRRCNDLTVLPRLPDGIGAVVYSSWFLCRVRAETPRTIEIPPDTWLALAADVDGTALRLEDVRRVPCRVDVPQDLPLRVRIDEPNAWETLPSSLRRVPKGRRDDEWRLVRSWRPAGWLRPERSRSSRRRERPRILFVSPSTGFSGSERMFVCLMNGLLARGCDLWGLTVRPGMIGSLLRSRFRTRLIADGVVFHQPTLASFEYCLRVMRRLRPSLVHCNGFTGWPILAAAEACDVRVLQHVRVAELAGVDDDLRRADGLIAVSNFVAAELRRAGVPNDRVRLCYDAIDVSHFRRDPQVRLAARRRLGIEDEAFMLLCVSRLAPEKRVEVVIDAFARALSTRRPAYLFVVGEIESPLYFESLRSSIAASGLDGAVRFLNAVEDMRPLHAASDALILASRREPLGIAMLEAMAMQNPVIASDSGGIPEILDASCGTLVDPGAPDGFAVALRRVVEGDSELARKALRGRAIVRRRFDLDDHVDAIQRIVQDVAG